MCDGDQSDGIHIYRCVLISEGACSLIVMPSACCIGNPGWLWELQDGMMMLMAVGIWSEWVLLDEKGVP